MIGAKGGWVSQEAGRSERASEREKEKHKACVVIDIDIYIHICGCKLQQRSDDTPHTHQSDYSAV